MRTAAESQRTRLIFRRLMLAYGATVAAQRVNEKCLSLVKYISTEADLQRLYAYVAWSLSRGILERFSRHQRSRQRADSDIPVPGLMTGPIVKGSDVDMVPVEGMVHLVKA